MKIHMYLNTNLDKLHQYFSIINEYNSSSGEKNLMSLRSEIFILIRSEGKYDPVLSRPGAFDENNIIQNRTLISIWETINRESSFLP